MSTLTETAPSFVEMAHRIVWAIGATVDPSIIPGWDSPDSPGFGVLRLAPRTLRVMPGTVMLEGRVEQLLRWQSPRS